jgi:hypothetical protein
MRNHNKFRAKFLGDERYPKTLCEEAAYVYAIVPLTGHPRSHAIFAGFVRGGGYNSVANLSEL